MGADVSKEDTTVSAEEIFDYEVGVGHDNAQQVQDDILCIVPCFGDGNNNDMKEITFKNDEVSTESSVSASFASGRGKSTMAPPMYLSKYIWNKDPHSTYQFCYPRLECNRCFVGGSHLLKVGNLSYHEALAYSSMWFETDFISGLAALATHNAHASHVLYVNCMTPLASLREDECRLHPSGIEKIVSVLHARSHFCVLTIDIARRTITIADGLKYSLDRWRHHVVNILKRCGLMTRTTAPKFNEDHLPGKYFVTGDGVEYTMSHEDYLEQPDGNSCGPIACAKVLEMFGLLKGHSNLAKLREEVRLCLVGVYCVNKN